MNQQIKQLGQSGGTTPHVKNAVTQPTPVSQHKAIPNSGTQSKPSPEAPIPGSVQTKG